MNRRDFLKSLLTTAVVAHELDYEKLLWVPGEKKIFLPSPRQVDVFSKKYITESQIVAAELQRISGILPTLFERNDLFFSSEYMVMRAGELVDTEINKRDPNHPIITCYTDMKWDRNES